MKTSKLKYNLYFLLTAAIWGLAFVAQRVGAQYMGSFSFNGIRFILGAVSLIPIMLFFGNNSHKKNQSSILQKKGIWEGIIAGLVLFLGASLQQIGLEETTAGKAAFITGLYMVLVPILGVFLKQYIHFTSWLGVLTSIVGLYFLSVNADFSISKGDLFELIGAFFWACHILVIDYFTKRIDAVKLSFFQFITCAALSMAVALFFEDITFNGILQAIVPLLYGGICSVGIAYTLQAIGQRHAHPAHAAIILSMESVFASLGGLIILNESLGLRGYIGCTLMLSGMLLSQFYSFSGTQSSNLQA